MKEKPNKKIYKIRYIGLVFLKLYATKCQEVVWLKMDAKAIQKVNLSSINLVDSVGDALWRNKLTAFLTHYNQAT